MLAQIPISPQANTAFSRSPKGIEKAGEVGNDFSDTFEAAAAARRQKEFGVDGTSENDVQAKTHGKKECKSSQNPVHKGQNKKAPADSEKSGRKAEAPETETTGSEPASMEEAARHSENTTLLQGFLGNDVEENADVVEELNADAVLGPKDGEGLLGSAANLPGDPRSKPANEEAPKVKFVFLDSQKVPSDGTKNNGNASTPLQSPKDKANGDASTPLRPPKDNAPNFLDLGEKFTKGGIHGQGEEAKGTVTPKMDQEKIDPAKADTGNVKKAMENMAGAAVRASRLNNTPENTNKKTGTETPAIFSLKKGQFSEKSVKSAWKTKIAEKEGRKTDTKQTKLPKGRPGLSREAADKAKSAANTEKKMPVLNGPRVQKSSALTKDGIDLKQPSNVETAAANWRAVAGKQDLNKNSESAFELHRATESKENDARPAEKSPQKRTASSSSSPEGASRPTNEKPTDAQSSGSNANDREGRENREKQRVSTDKHSVGMTEKMEATKGDEGTPVPKAKYGAINGNDPVAAETGKEAQKPSVAKENLGSLVKTASFLLKNGRQEARIALHPDSLGHLKIRITMEQQQVTVRVMAETGAAKELIEHNLHQLKADFQQQGLEIAKFDVTLSQDSNSNNSSGAGQNPFLASNRSKGRLFRKQQGPQESASSEQRVVTPARGHHSDAVDFFA